MKTDLKTRHGGRILADALAAQGVKLAFGVPGESYLPVLDGLHEEANAERVAEQVVAVAEAPFELPGLQPLQIGASVGVAFWRPGQASWREVLRRADAMLYRAKAQGRGRAVTTAL